MRFGIIKEEVAGSRVRAKKRRGAGLLVTMGILVPKDPPAGGDAQGKEPGVRVKGDCGKVQRAGRRREACGDSAATVTMTSP